MLDNHEYDPDCKFCCDNKFVKDAHKAKESLPELNTRLHTYSNLSKRFAG